MPKRKSVCDDPLKSLTAACFREMFFYDKCRSLDSVLMIFWELPKLLGEIFWEMGLLGIKKTRQRVF
jgi:hypothetical protein